MSDGNPVCPIYKIHQNDEEHERVFQECVINVIKRVDPQLLSTGYVRKVREDYDYMFRTLMKTYTFAELTQPFSLKPNLEPISRFSSKPIAYTSAGEDSSLEHLKRRVKRDHPSIPKQQPPPPFKPELTQDYTGFFKNGPPPEDPTRLLSKKRPRQDIPEPLPPTYASAGGGDSSLENEKRRPIQDHPTIPNVSKKRPRQDIPLGWLSYEDITKQSPPEPMAPHPPTYASAGGDSSSLEDEKPPPIQGHPTLPEPPAFSSIMLSQSG